MTEVSRRLLQPEGDKGESQHPQAREGGFRQKEGMGETRVLAERWQSKEAGSTELMCFWVSLTRFTSGRSGMGVPCPIASLYLTCMEMGTPGCYSMLNSSHHIRTVDKCPVLLRGVGDGAYLVHILSGSHTQLSFSFGWSRDKLSLV